MILQPDRFKKFAAALADLNEQAAASVLREHLPEIKNEVVTEAFQEAIRRLENQSEPPTRADRMVHLFGTVTATERALGAESDNEFLKRAQIRQGARMDVVYEADDSEPEADENLLQSGRIGGLPYLRDVTDEALREIAQQYDDILAMALNAKQPPGIRESAILILFQLRPTTAIEDIAPILELGPLELIIVVSRDVPQYKAEGGEKIKSPFAITELARQMEDPNQQYQAIGNLARMDDDRIAGLLLQALSFGKNEQREALRALGKQKAASAVPQIVPYLKSDRGQHVAAAAEALARIGTDDAIAALADENNYAHLKSLMKTMEKRWVARAICFYRNNRIESDLKQYSQNKDFDVREGASEALAWWKGNRSKN